MTVLNEKNVPHDIQYIDLSNKPDWFLAISPTGKVPVVETPEGHLLFESAVINEYLDETHPPHFLKGTPWERAQERMWLDFVSGMYGEVYRTYTADDEAAFYDALGAARAKLAKLEAVVVGPLFRGQEFGLVDATAAPLFTRLSWIERLVPEMGAFDELPKTHAWGETLLARPSVQNSVLPDIFELFVASLQRSGAWLSTRVGRTAIQDG